MSMSLPLQIAIHQSAYTSAVGAAKNNSSAPGPEQVQEVCEACGQVIETATEYTAGEMLAGIIVGGANYCGWRNNVSYCFWFSDVSQLAIRR